MTRPTKTDYQTLTPYLAVKGAVEALEFYKKAFGAVQRPICLTDPDGNVVHAEMTIGDSIVMLGEESLQFAAPSPITLGGTSVKLGVTVDDADAWVARAVEAGATLISPVEDQFYGERSGRISDPYGHVWIIGTKIEDVSPEEMQTRMNAMFGV